MMDGPSSAGGRFTGAPSNGRGPVHGRRVKAKKGLRA